MDNENDKAFPGTFRKVNDSTHVAFIGLIEKSQRRLVKRTKFQTLHGCPILEEKADSNLPGGKVVEVVLGMAQGAATQCVDPASVVLLAAQQY